MQYYAKDGTPLLDVFPLAAQALLDVLVVVAGAGVEQHLNVPPRTVGAQEGCHLQDLGVHALAAVIAHPLGLGEQPLAVVSRAQAEGPPQGVPACRGSPALQG